MLIVKIPKRKEKPKRRRERPSKKLAQFFRRCSLSVFSQAYALRPDWRRHSLFLWRQAGIYGGHRRQEWD